MHYIHGCKDHADETVMVIPVHSWSPDEVEAYVTCLKNEADRHWSIDANISLQYADKIIAIGYLVEQAPYIALGMMASGDALKNLGRVIEAFDALQSAGNVYQQCGDDVGWARTRIGMVYIAADVQRVEETLQESQRARQILIECGQLQRCVYLEMNLATLFVRLGDSDRASQHYDKALDLTYQLGTDFSYMLWPIHYNQAFLWTETGDLHRAEANFDRAIVIAREQDATRNLILALGARARLYVFQGKHRKALLMLYEAIELAERIAANELLFLHRIMAECYWNLNRYREARLLANKSAISLEAKGFYHEAAISLYHKAKAEMQLEHYEEALASLDGASQYLLRSEHQTNISLWQSRHFSLRGRIALRQRDDARAKQWITRTLHICEEGSIISLETHLLEAERLIHQRHYDAANKCLEQIRRSADDNHLSGFIYQVHVLCAFISEKMGQYPQAITAYKDAIRVIEEAQKHLTISLQSGFMMDKTEATHRLIQLYIQAREIEPAFAMLERMKAQILMGYLSNRDSLHWHRADEQTSCLLESLNTLRAEYHWYTNLLHQQVNLNATPESAIPYDTLQAEINSREKQIRAITEQLYLHNEDTPHFGLQDMPTLSEIQSRLKSQDVLIEYYNDGRSYYVFIVTPDNLKIHKLVESSQAIDRLINKLQPNLEWALDTDIEDPLYSRLLEVFQKIARRLYKTLIEWLEPSLNEETRLWIVPFGVLHYLSFNSLFDGKQYLIEKHDLIVLPASSLLVNESPSQEGAVRILADSRSQTLPATLQEAQTIHSLVGGECYIEEDARRQLLMNTPVKVLHIAAHGEYRIDVPELSYIQLGDGQLFMDDLMQEDLRYEMVVLSGCETGRAKVMPGDELIGIGRGVIVGGAGSLIASLWRVDDETMLHLMHRLYQCLINGATKAQALRQAQLDLLRDQPDRHPAYWSALQLIGDPQPIRF